MKTLKLLKPAIEVFHFPKFTKASEVLTAAKQVIQDERRWTREKLAETQVPEMYDGKIVGIEIESCAARVPKSGKSKAIAFCALGAVQFVNGPAEKEATKFLKMAAAIDLRKAAIDKKTGQLMGLDDGDRAQDDEGNMIPWVYRLDDYDIFTVNDEEGDHKRVLGMFSLAIKLAKKAGN
jgi:hypothetical protein